MTERLSGVDMAVTSTSHIKIKKFVQNNNYKGHRSKHFVFDTHIQVSCAGL
ncbi:conserved hypothetical protein [uncultured Citrobacter sp.]|nr:conserved hypothetical protein [uncultured Citrobacter sp.]SBV69292.1 conserved hypothetical protein [uncultured Citrobacter sp.]